MREIPRCGDDARILEETGEIRGGWLIYTF